MALQLQKYTRKSSPDGLVVRTGALMRQITTVSSSVRYTQFARLNLCKFLKTIVFPVNLRPVSGQINAYHIDPVHEFIT